ncbi:MAG: DivIVA domain-containing protein, partial [Bacteroidota bacterium]
MITPQEIKSQSFRRVMRGYDREEVHAFLQALAQEWEQQLVAHKDLKEELERTKASYRTLKEVEDMLHRTLMQAEQSARDTVENA